MVSYQDWVKIAFELAADDVSPQRVIARAGTIWNKNNARLKSMNMNEARRVGKQQL